MFEHQKSIPPWDAVTASRLKTTLADVCRVLWRPLSGPSRRSRFESVPDLIRQVDSIWSALGRSSHISGCQRLSSDPQRPSCVHKRFLHEPPDHWGIGRCLWNLTNMSLLAFVFRLLQPPGSAVTVPT